MKTLVAACCLLFAAAGASAQTYNGSLATGDTQRDNSSYYDAYTVDVSSPQEIVVRMEATDFDTYLIVRSPSGLEQINDDFEGQQVSQLELMATEAGKWTIHASSYESGATGPYVVTVTRGRLLDVQTTQGRLDYSDPLALKGEYFDTADFELTGSEQVIVELITFGFDGYLVVTSPDGQVWRNDDYNGSTSASRVGPVTGSTGKWRVNVTSLGAGEQGAYDLRIIRVKN